MKKLKGFLISTIPTIIAIGLQTIAYLYLLCIAIIFFVTSSPLSDIENSLMKLIPLVLDMNFNSVVGIVFSFFCMVIFGIWYYRSCNGSFKFNLKKDFHPYELLGILLLVPGTQLMSSIITSLLSVLFPSWLESYLELMETSGLSGEIPVLMVVYAIFMAPISEELVFRGVTYSIARRTFSFWGANVIQALLFGIFHMNPIQGCYTFALGLVLGYIREKGGTLYHVILFHFLFNLWGTTASEWMIFENEILQVLVIFGGAAIGIAGGLLLFNKGNQKKLQQL